MGSEASPAVMREDLAGLDIGDGLITAARVLPRRRGHFAVTHAGWERYPVDASDRDIAHAVKRLWQESRMRVRTVCSCLRTSSVALKPFKYANLSEADLPSALKLEAEESLQLPPDGIVVDWHARRSRAAKGNSGAAGDIEGILVAAGKADVERHVSILRMADLYPVILDIGCMAVSNLRLALTEPAAEPKDVCIVNLGRRLADIVVLYGEVAIYPRVVFSRAADWENAADYLAASIEDVLKHHRFRLRRQPLQQVELCGRVPSDGRLIQRLRDATGVAVETWNPLKDLRSKLRVSRALAGRQDEMGPALAASLGLAIRRN